MRLDGWDIAAFGVLEDLKADGLSDHDVVVLLGDNEAGKSTFFEFLTTMLFGFRPTSRDKHPYNPWSGRPPHGSLSLVLPDAGRATVTRRLLSAPQGQIVSSDGETSLDNRPVPWVGALTRRMYRNVFALTLDDANNFDEGTWRELEEQLLGGASFDFIIPAREAIEKLGTRANELWRTDRKGKPLAKMLDQKMGELRTARNEARARLKDTLALEQRSLDISQELEELEASLREKKTRVRQANELMPVVRSVRDIRGLRAEAEAILGDREIPHYMEVLWSQAGEEKSRIDTGIAELAATIEGLESRSEITEEDERFLQCAEDINALAQQSEAQVLDSNRQEELKRKAANLNERIKERAEMVFSTQVTDEIAAALAQLPMAELRGRIKVWVDSRRPLEKAEDELHHAQRELESAQTELAGLPEIGGEKRLRKRLELLQALQSQESFISILEEEKRLDSSGVWARHGARIISAILFLGALVMGGVVASGLAGQPVVLGAVALGLAVLAVLHEVFRRRAVTASGGRLRSLRASCAKLRQELGLTSDAPVEQEIEPIQQQLQTTIGRSQLASAVSAKEKAVEQRAEEEKDRHEERESSRRDILKVLEAIPVVDVRLELPDKELASELDGIRTTLRELHETQEELDAVRGRVDARNSEARDLGDRLNSTGTGQPMDHVKSLVQRLQESEEARTRVNQTRDQLGDNQQLMRVKEEAREEAKKKVENLEAILASIDTEHGAPQKGRALLADARNSAAQAKTLEQSLPPGWKEKIETFESLEGAGVQIELDTEALVTLETEIANLEQRQSLLHKEQGTVEQQSTDLATLVGVDDVEGEIQALTENQQRIRVQRDRLMLLRSIIREADNRYRAEHQPTVFRQASKYISAITRGRYSALSIDTTMQATQLVVRHPDDISPKPLEPCTSRGTREQVYLALRMAFTDHIGGDLALPLILDELFVNWDPGRTDQGLQLVAEASKKRQTLLLTCHPELADKVEKQLGGKVLAMPGAAPKD